MTNTVYFHSTIRDNGSFSTADDSFSTATEEESPATSRRHTSHHQQRGVVTAADAINSRIPSTFGLNLEDDNNDGSDVASDSSEIFSLNSIARTSARVEYWSINTKEFSFNELKSATRNFHNDHRLGKLGFGRVFKGWIDENKLTATKPGKGIAVAIKHSLQGHTKWLAEVKYLGWLRHPNLVRLFGYCLDNEQHLLVYEFMHRGSLDNHLYGYDSSPLSWSVQMKIALGVAKGLAFLHSAAINIIHRGVASSNILLDSDYNAKLTNFGFATDGPTGQALGGYTKRSWVSKIRTALTRPTDISYASVISYVSTSLVGDHRFIAPEYYSTGHLTAKSDVYSFGAVLIDILLGGQSTSLSLYMCGDFDPCISEREIFLLRRSQLSFHCSVGNAKKAANLAGQCLAEEAQFRPNMVDVVKKLEQLQVC